jgi:hypothetical protein
MKFSKMIILIVCALTLGGSSIVYAAAAERKPDLAADPFSIHKTPFGPDIEGLQLGKTFEKFADIFSFMGARTSPPDTFRLVFIIDAIRENARVGSVKFTLEIHAEREPDLLFKAEDDVDIPGLEKPKTLKEQQEREKWGLGDYIALLDGFPNWVIAARMMEAHGNSVSQSGCFFLRESSDVFRLVSFAVGSVSMKYLYGYKGNMGDVNGIAAFVIEKYGFDDLEKGLSENEYSGSSYFHRDSEGGYVLDVTRDGFSVSPITGGAVYPLFAWTRRAFDTNYITEAEAINNRDFLSKMAGFQIEGVTDWRFRGYKRDYKNPSFRY